MTFAEAKNLATLAGVAIGVGSLLFAAFNLFITANTNRARFWLDLRSAFAKHDDVHRNLRPGGKWADKAGPTTSDEYFQIEAYMGLFEHCESLLSQRLIDEATPRDPWYRLKNLVANKWFAGESCCRCRMEAIHCAAYVCGCICVF
jgi:hypothetical protein